MPKLDGLIGSLQNKGGLIGQGQGYVNKGGLVGNGSVAFGGAS